MLCSIPGTFIVILMSSFNDFAHSTSEKGPQTSLPSIPKMTDVSFFQTIGQSDPGYLWQVGKKAVVFAIRSNISGKVWSTWTWYHIWILQVAFDSRNLKKLAVWKNCFVFFFETYLYTDFYICHHTTDSWIQRKSLLWSGNERGVLSMPPWSNAASPRWGFMETEKNDPSKVAKTWGFLFTSSESQHFSGFHGSFPRG